jgi:hypothetical protein
LNIVLYTRDFEAITIIDVPMWAIDRMRTRDSIRIPIQSAPLNYSVDHSIPVELQFMYAEIYMERMKWIDGSMKSIFITDSDELALLLKPAWLPGQQGEINKMVKTQQLLLETILRSISRGES